MNKLLSVIALALGSAFSGGQVVAADTFTQNGHGCAACEICTAKSCSCREFDCKEYLEMVAKKPDKLSAAATVKHEVKATTLAKPAAGAVVVDTAKKK